MSADLLSYLNPVKFDELPYGNTENLIQLDN